ncbi:MAG: type II secretion system protein [Planctomycetota bacterium]|jgi:hypothetical protein
MKTRGLTLVEFIVVIVILVLAAGVLMPGLRPPRQRAIRLVCGTNLQGIGRGMIAFAKENDGMFARAGVPGTTWTVNGILHMWWGGRSGTEDEAFRIIRDASGNITYPGEATITSSIYLLIKHRMAKPKHFVCPGDEGAKAFDITKTRGWRFLAPKPNALAKAFDFGAGGRGPSPYEQLPVPGEVCSYAYHMPYSDPGYGLSLVIRDVSHPRSPVCADRNPHLDKNVVAPEIHTNSMCHTGRGQNVLYKDGSVKFETSVTVGLGGDNIYTYGGDYGTGGGDPFGTPPAGSGDGAPVGPKDAYLVGEQNYQ